MTYFETPYKDRYIEYDYAEMWIRDGILFGKYKNGIILDLKGAQDILKDRETLSEGVRFPLFFDGRGVRYWTKEARDFQNTERNYKLMKAAAVIITNSYVPNMIINFIVKFEKPLIPMKFFHNEEKGVKWLLQYTSPQVKESLFK